MLFATVIEPIFDKIVKNFTLKMSYIWFHMAHILAECVVLTEYVALTYLYQVWSKIMTFIRLL